MADAPSPIKGKNLDSEEGGDVSLTSKRPRNALLGIAETGLHSNTSNRNVSQDSIGPMNNQVANPLELV